MAGQVTPRKLFTGMVPDLKLIALMASLKERNAETIFGAISAEIEINGSGALGAEAAEAGAGELHFAIACSQNAGDVDAALPDAAVKSKVAAA